MRSFIPIPPDLWPEQQRELGRIVNERFQFVSDELASISVVPATTGTQATAYTGSHVARMKLAANTVPEGSEFWEQDRLVLYRATTWSAATGRTWRFIAGEMADTLANKPTDLGVNDAGFKFRATNYERVWRWTGSAWVRWAGELPTLAVIDSAETFVSKTGWHELDGTSVTYTKDDATTGSLTLPNGLGLFLKQGVYDGVANAATTGTITGSTGSTTATGTVSAVTLTGSNAFASGANGAITGPTSQTPTFTGVSHSHTVGTLAVAGSDPGHVKVYRAVRL